jgi:hypothetical protein
MNNPLGNNERLKYVLIFFIIVYFCLNWFYYYFNVNITAYVKDLLTDNPKLDIVVEEKKSNHQGTSIFKEVYNIPGNHYNYENAKAVCSAYGSTLATYNQIEAAYKDGAEWCNYGWSADQIALFPTQEKTYNHLQTIEGHEHDCGRPGINGGYIENEKVKLGVNCYGNKPKITDEEESLMKSSSQYPETTKEKLFEKRVSYWKGKVDQILVSPFNNETWASS